MPLAGSIARALLALCWHAVRWPALACLIVLEPLVSAMLLLASLLTLFAALFFEFLTESPEFPFWGMLGLSAALALGVAAYHALIRLLTSS